MSVSYRHRMVGKCFKKGLETKPPADFFENEYIYEFKKRYSSYDGGLQHIHQIGTQLKAYFGRYCVP